MTAPTPQELVEHGLKASTSDSCVVLVRDSTRANLRWANNTLTTNGVMHDVTVTVIAFRSGAEGTATGSVTASAASVEQVTRIVEAADAAAAASGPADDAQELTTGDAAADWSDAPGIHLDRGLLRLRPGARRGLRPGHGRGTRPLRLRRPRRHHDLPRLHAPACGCGTSSPPATTAAPARTPT